MTVVSRTSHLSVTFSQQSELWLALLKTRKRKTISPATLHTFGSYIRRLTPMVDEMKLADINNGVLRDMVQKLDEEELSAKTINELIAVVKSVVGSLVDPNTGEPLLKREWSAQFIDAPSIRNQKQPCLARQKVERCIHDAASDQERVLYCVLAGTGLRIAEALAIHINGGEDQTSWRREDQAIHVRSSIFGGKEIQRLKTDAAKRTVDLDPTLNDLIAGFIEREGIQTGAYLFQARSGRPMHLKTARERLAKHGIPGFHSFRRFRITRLREVGVPEDILRFWVGHEGQNITDRYSKLGENVELRREWCRRVSLGFECPELCSPARHPAPKVHSAPQPGITPEPVEEVPRYEATDDDLPLELFQPQPTPEALVEVE